MKWVRRHFKFIILVVLLAFIFGALTGSRVELPDLSKFLQPTLEDEQIRTMIAPAVDNEGNGVPSHLIVTVKPGRGLVLVNINDVLAGFDTQDSAKVAAQEAGKYTGANLNSLDIIYSIEAEAPLISGASAGAAMAIATIAAIEEKVLNPKVSITGALNNESVITQVGGVLPKAEAVKSLGVEVFLVPGGQGVADEFKRELNCEIVDSTEICRTQYVSKGISLGADLGIEVIEVNTIEEAVPYFIE